MNKQIQYLIFISCCFFINLSCNSNQLYKESITINSKSWSYQQILNYKWQVENTTFRYSLTLQVNHSNDLAFRNVYVKCKTTFPDNQVKEQVLSLELFDESGKPYGKCSSSECNTNIKLIYATRFPLPGTYQLSLEQYGRDSLLNGIESLGLLIEKEK